MTVRAPEPDSFGSTGRRVITRRVSAATDAAAADSSEWVCFLCARPTPARDRPIIIIIYNNNTRRHRRHRPSEM